MATVLVITESTRRRNSEAEDSKQISALAKVLTSAPNYMLTVQYANQHFRPTIAQRVGDTVQYI